MCDPQAVEIILGFTFGGAIILKVAIQYLKKLLKVQGDLAKLLSLGVCAIASALFILATGGEWICILTYAPQLWAANQVVHIVKKK